MPTRLRVWIVTVLLVVAAACLGYLSTRYAFTTDWSAQASATLSSTSRAVLKQLDGPVRITSYARPGNRQRAQIVAFIRRYQRFKPGIALHFVDPEQNPEAMRKTGITVNGEVVVHYKGHERHLKQLSERSLTNVLESLSRGSDRIVAFVTGDGERAAAGTTPADLGTFVHQLEQRGVRAVPLNFAQVPQVPENTRLVVLASPLQTLSKGAVKALLDYVKFGGNLLWLTEPGSADTNLQPLADSLSIQVLPGVLVDGRGSAIGLSDPRMVATAHYPTHAITQGFHLTTIFPRVAALAQASMGQWKVTPLLRSSARSWTENQPIDGAHPSTIHFDAGTDDRKGPLDFGLALTRLSSDPSHNQQRVMVIGGGSFLSNAYLGQGGNRALGKRLFNWLMDDDALIGVPPSKALTPALKLGQRGLNWLSAVYLFALPLLLVLIGVVVGWRRRRR